MSSYDSLDFLIRDVQKLFNMFVSLLQALQKVGGTRKHIDWICDPRNASFLIQFINREFVMNHYAMTVREQIEVLRRASDEEGWGIEEEVFTRLEATAPVWPEGRESYRSFRIRFGEGDEGVTLTLKRHLDRMKSVFTKLHCTFESDLFMERHSIRLRNGNHVHKPIIEWIVADLSAHQYGRQSIEEAHNSRSLADELLVAAWMFPERILSINETDFPSMYAAGYEVNDVESAHPVWSHAVIICLFKAGGSCLLNEVCVTAFHDDSHTGNSVPELLDK